MSRHWRTALRGGLVALVGMTWLSPALAAKPGELRREAEQLVTEALFQESLGLNRERERLLSEAEQKAPSTARLHWAQGRVKHGNRWIDFDDVPQLLRSSDALTRYQRKRGDYPDTAAGQLALARYCERHGLDDQARAHLVRVLEHAPNHAGVRRELGFALVNGKWMHQDDVALATRAAAQRRENFGRWQKRILDLRHDLTARASAQRASAGKRLAAIDDPTALPALEVLLCYGRADVAAQAIATIGAMTEPEASLVLARVAVHAPVGEVREAASQRLEGRPFEQYVPHLLAALSTPVETRENIAIDARGRLLHQQVFIREGQEQSQLLVRGTEYRRQYVRGGSAEFAAWQAGLDMAEQNSESGLRVALDNLETLDRNQRVAQALASGTGQAIGADVKAWWNWWNEYNDLKFAGPKPVAVQVALRRVSVLDGIPLDSGSSGGGSGGGGSSTPGTPPRRSECLVAGTVVHTSTGLVPVEQVRIGDLVLAQHPESGELAYKPVLKTTITPSGPLMRVEAGDYDTFRCTPGHLFWVSGEGWRQARQLRSGAPLHTPRGTVTVSLVAPAKAEQTYNLIVADFHTYFAGQRAVLCHDNTLRQPTRAVVPGVVVE